MLHGQNLIINKKQESENHLIQRNINNEQISADSLSNSKRREKSHSSSSNNDYMSVNS